MFDEIFKRWIKTGQLTNADIVPLFLEYDQEFLGGKARPEEILFFISHFQTDYRPMMSYILRMVGIRRGYHWEEVKDVNGRVLYRFMV